MGITQEPYFICNHERNRQICVWEKEKEELLAAKKKENTIDLPKIEKTSKNRIRIFPNKIFASSLASEQDSDSTPPTTPFRTTQYPPSPLLHIPFALTTPSARGGLAHC
jgi:hypothetical protein